MVRRYAKECHLIEIHSHCLHHSIASIWLKEGKSIRGVQKQLSHKSLITTQIYMDYFDDEKKRIFVHLN